MRISSHARNKLLLSEEEVPSSDQYQWQRWIFPTLVAIGLVCIFVMFFFSHTIAASIAAVIWLSIGALCLASLFIASIAITVAAIKVIMATSNKPYPEHPLPTYEEVEQMDEKQLPSYEELVNSGMNTAPPISAKQACSVSGESPPPYGAFFEESSNSRERVLTPFQPHIELTLDRPGYACMG